MSAEKKHGDSSSSSIWSLCWVSGTVSLTYVGQSTAKTEEINIREQKVIRDDDSAWGGGGGGSVQITKQEIKKRKNTRRVILKKNSNLFVK